MLTIGRLLLAPGGLLLAPLVWVRSRGIRLLDWGVRPLSRGRRFLTPQSFLMRPGIYLWGAGSDVLRPRGPIPPTPLVGIPRVVVPVGWWIRWVHGVTVRP